MKSKHICLKCGNESEFLTVAHVSQTWKVDAEGNWIKTVSDCDEIVAPPDNGNSWTCAKCGEEAHIVVPPAEVTN